MKTLLPILSLLIMSFTISSDKPVDKLGVNGPLEFNKTKFELAWTSHPNENYYIQEYLLLMRN